MLLSAVAVLVPSFSKPADAAPRTKFTICHRTNAIKNPYRRITVAWSSVNADGNGHDNSSHDGPVFDIGDPTATPPRTARDTHGTTPRDSGLGPEAGGGNDRWGDIFNVSRTTGPASDRQNSNNWTTAGEAIFNGATFTLDGVTKQACKTMSAVEYIESEFEAGIPIADIVAELDEMEAAEDTLLKSQLTGGSFSSWYDSCTSSCNDVTAISSALSEVPQANVTTESPSAVLPTSATLNGTITPLSNSMLWYFELSITNDFTESNSDIINEPSSPLGPSTAVGPVNVTRNVTGLTAGTTYYYRTVGIIASGSGDSAVESFYYGVVKQFNSNYPAVTTEPATSVTETTATINGTGTSNGAASTVTFTWGTQPELSGGDTTSNATPTPPSLLSTDANTAFSLNLTGLTPGTTYYFRASITNTNGSADGIIRQFTTPGPPVVTTVIATSVTETTATINGAGTTNGANSTVTFTWGTRSDLTGGDTQTGVAATPGSLTDPLTNEPFALNLTGLTGGTRYYFQAVITNSNGTRSGSILNFITLTPVNQNVVTPPEVTTEPATSVTGTTATINGTGTSNGATSTVTFTWGTSSTLASGTTTVNATPSSLDANASGTAVSSALTGLTPGTTYYFRTSITNTNGSADGVIREFTTPSVSSATADPLGRVIGTAWFDINRNNRRDAGEPLLPGVDVQLTATGVTGQSAGTVRKTNYVMKTTSDGSFDFPDLPAGTYLITSLLPDEFGIQESWDTTGNSDWKVTVTVVALETSRGDFAAIGSAQADGTVDGGDGGTLDATWAGFDQKDGTNDDVVFTAKIATDDEFTLTGLPTGKYTVKATSKSGRTLVSSSTLRVTSTGATLTLNGITMKVKIVGFLPQTGVMNMFLPFGFATMLLPAGVAVTVATRRRRTSRL